MKLLAVCMLVALATVAIEARTRKQARKINRRAWGFGNCIARTVCGLPSSIVISEYDCFPGGKHANNTMCAGKCTGNTDPPKGPDANNAKKPTDLDCLPEGADKDEPACKYDCKAADREDAAKCEGVECPEDSKDTRCTPTGRRSFRADADCVDGKDKDGKDCTNPPKDNPTTTGTATGTATGTTTKEPKFNCKAPDCNDPKNAKHYFCTSGKPAANPAQRRQILMRRLGKFASAKNYRGMARVLKRMEAEKLQCTRSGFLKYVFWYPVAIVKCIVLFPYCAIAGCGDNEVEILPPPTNNGTNTNTKPGTNTGATAGLQCYNGGEDEKKEECKAFKCDAEDKDKPECTKAKDLDCKKDTGKDIADPGCLYQCYDEGADKGNDEKCKGVDCKGKD